MRDIDLAIHLEFSRPRDIRALAKGMLADLGKIEVRGARPRTRGVDGIVQEKPVQESWYTEEQAMWVTPTLVRNPLALEDHHPSASRSLRRHADRAPPSPR
jgi:hypothetical protein